MFSILRSIGITFTHAFRKRETKGYPEKAPFLPARYRARIILTRDPDGKERCVACNLCAAACPTDCISLQATQDETGRRYPEFFRINFSRCIFCGYCEDACPTNAIQLTPDFEIAEYNRQNLVYEKENLLINGVKCPYTPDPCRQLILRERCCSVPGAFLLIRFSRVRVV